MPQTGTARYYFLDGIAVVEVVGEESLELLLDVYARLIKDAAFRHDMPKLLDDRRVTHFIGPQDLMRIRDEIAKHYAGIKAKRRIATVSHDPMAAKMMRLFEDIRDTGPDTGDVEHEFFASMAEAIAWLKSAPATK